MDINMALAINWYIQNIGKHTYSEGGAGNPPRFDCSSSVSLALQAAGAPNFGLLSTVTLGAELAKLGFKKVYSGPTKGATGVANGDVVLMSGGANMSVSGGSNGHTGIIGTNGNFYNTTATDWKTGDIFVPNDAVQVAPWNEYITHTRLTEYTEIWRYTTTFTVANKSAISTKVRKVKVDGLWQPVITPQETTGAIQDYLNSIGYSLDPDEKFGDKTAKAFQTAINAKLKAMGINYSIGVDGIFKTKSIKGLRYILGTRNNNDDTISTPSTVVTAMQNALNSGKQWL